MSKNNSLLIPVAAIIALLLGIGVSLWRIEPGEADLAPDQLYAAKFSDLAGK